ncbi:MAG: NAD(P)(+) transhydrogenase (Re/Si-specific) subunit alpha [Zetaproteobacteria bacterium CG12_big_fil_rev_8_21_14_0_65_55_1124]|nr:MAG: NADP transhydrogenase subunit alpha [Zetaproteobacteria bacterium CG1_02_55_237]PIS19922.1 MAG: NAD(P)(+) transhydrogenase (Re/Si-specific) subunit alpha [Zetaproteobacteria bacterium CG08_land_8_20_14_0_20_55_17]PIW43655.1 MAG: NAD(P)(+) transhydrogenase (Re/Si-specific) subunit alpha [Zetaproteobacteria bacterium CG12_big_fil_rev_8_21_14_0_65_55_1124]PIY52676.1 MAG: NAD(P)(+) transhydrogenase (Re/Si-specific) subunit alpha [Zetaproteobacteria bacterium CG_4_10_14_0_8_um_filter_55_43]P
MLLVVPAEIRDNEARVAATPETIKKFVAQGFTVQVQAGAGNGSLIADADYEAAGATIVKDAKSLLKSADIVLKVRAPEKAEIKLMSSNATVISLFSPFTNPLLSDYAKHGLTCFALEMVPRISRAQSMDVLSSQANIAGYKAVLMAAEHYRRFFPMMMTAAGTVQPAHVLVMGAGVAGLQAIATARRLGALVEAFDVRAAAREQVESLGAKFVEVPVEEDAEDAGGYAKEVSEEYKQKQAELIAKHAAKADIVITTALIPGRPAPVLVTEEVVKAMKPGSVIVDMAAEMGGNCPLTELDKTVVKHGVTLIGESNIPSLVAADASQLYARNLNHFLTLMCDGEGGLNTVLDDEIITAAVLCREGEFLKPQFLKGGAA